MPSVQGNLKANALTLQGHGALGADLKMNVTDDNFVMSMGSNVLMTVAPEEAGVLNSDGVTDTVISLHKNVAVQGDLSATGAVSAHSVSSDSVSAVTISTTGPIHDGFTPYTAAQHTAVQSFANAIADGPNIPNSFVAYGNANTTDINVKVSGKQSDGSDVPANPYFRLASCSKIIGALCAAKLMSDRWINLDTPIAAYLGNGTVDASGIEHGDVIRDSSGNPLTAPWKSANRQIIDTSGNLTTMAAAWAAWGAEQTPVVATPCPDITVNHCLTMCCGLSYDYWTFARYTGLMEFVKDNTSLQRASQYGYSDYLTAYATGQVGTSFTGTTMAAPARLFDASGNPTYTSDQYVGLLSSQPLSSLPGVFCEYGRGYDLLGFFFDQVIKQNLSAFQTYYGNTNIVDAITFMQQLIFIPIGMNDTWVSGGQSEPPTDVKTRMISASFARNKISNVGAKCAPYGILDTSQNNLRSVNGVAVAKYSCTDASGFTYTGYFDSSNNALTVFADHVPKDTNATSVNELYYAPKNSSLKHVGQMGSAWGMSAQSYAKMQRLQANKGFDIVSGRRIIAKSAMSFISQASVPNGTYVGLTDYDHFKNFHNIPLEYSFAISQPLLWSYGGLRVMNEGSMPNNSPYATLGSAAFNLPINNNGFYPMVEGGKYWTGVYNNVWYMDPDSGNFAVWGTSQPTWCSLNANLYNLGYTHIALSASSDPSPNNKPYAATRLITILDGAQQ